MARSGGAHARSRNVASGRYATKKAATAKSAAVDAYLRRLKAMGPDEVLRKRIDDLAKDAGRPA